MRQTLCDGYLVIFALAQAVILLMLTPLFTGISRQIRARMHSRRGPGIWQDYRDIHKLFKRQEVAPISSGLMNVSALFRYCEKPMALLPGPVERRHD